MGNCCKKNGRESEKLDFDMEAEKAGIKSPEELERLYTEMLKIIEIDNPLLKVLFFLYS